ncbi:M23 family metallopeptidase [Candidatus Micrarchaeota archaeon]|nr:M23 family metallopeptidase [Candidatus Micrarchaeota archaeon]
MADEVFDELRELMRNTTALLGRIPSEREAERKRLHADLATAAKAHMERKLNVTLEVLAAFTARFEALTRPEEERVVEPPPRVEERELGERVYRKKEPVVKGVVPRMNSEDWSQVAGGIPPMGLYSARRTSDDGATFAHRAIDIYAKEGTELVPATVGDAVVVYAGDAGDKAGFMVVTIGRNNFGQVVVASYVHCERIIAKLGDRVQGWGIVTVPKPIATVGRTGNAAETGPHVHFMLANGIRVKDADVARELSGKELDDFFEKLVGMRDNERRTFLREHPVNFSTDASTRLNPEIEIRRGSVGSPVQNFKNISAKYCEYASQQKGAPALQY